ncbi:MAG: hypothetical protein LBT27_04880 [Prevotellaceae bacterium]|nr:hypothetical protein [Prevotellaceae bacterium]
MDEKNYIPASEIISIDSRDVACNVSTHTPFQQNKLFSGFACFAANVVQIVILFAV